MNFADIENTWRSPLNRPTAAELEEQKTKFNATLRRRDRAYIIWIAIIVVYVIQVTAFVWHSVFAEVGTDLSRQCTAVACCVIMLAVPIYMIRRYRAYRSARFEPANTTATSLRGLLDQNRLSQVCARFILFLQPLAALTLAYLINWIPNDPNTGQNETAAALVTFAIGQVIAVSYVAWIYFTTLRPEQRRLRLLLSSYEQV